jgi:hypothetical protein
MKQTLIYPALAIAIFSYSPLAFSSSYQSEISIRYSEYDVDYADNPSSIALEGIRYFAPVDTTNVPFAEAAFLGKASSFSVRFARDDYESAYREGNNYQRSADVNYYVPDSMFFVGAGIRQYKTDYEYSYYYPDYGYYEGEYESEWESTWIGRLGITPVDGLLVWSEFYEHQDLSEYWNLNAKYVKPLANNKAIGIESTFAQISAADSQYLNVVADYYFAQAFSIGAGISYDDDSDDSSNLLIRSRYFLTDKISLELAYADDEYSNNWRAGGNIRF